MGVQHKPGVMVIEFYQSSRPDVADLNTFYVSLCKRRDGMQSTAVKSVLTTVFWTENGEFGRSGRPMSGIYSFSGKL